MKISYHTVKDNLDVSRGYGAAGFRVVTSLQQLGHEVPFDDPSAPVQISFCQPAWYNFHPGQYKIGYTPWESTELPSGWADYMNQCDEVWATSDWVANVFVDQGVTVPVHVYEHGLDHRWEPIKRTRGEKIKFLHVGEPALRKGGQMALDAFREVFGDREDVHLTVKAYAQHYIRSWKDGHVTKPDDIYNNVTFVTENLHFDELIELYNEHDVLIYPSYGEGFGLIPLQGMGTGMPVICTDDWAPYKKYLSPLDINGNYDRSVWSLHPGEVYYPNYHLLKNTLSWSVDNIDYLFDKFYAQAEEIHREYDWVKKTEEAFEHIVNRFTKM